MGASRREEPLDLRKTNTFALVGGVHPEGIHPEGLPAPHKLGGQGARPTNFYKVHLKVNTPIDADIDTWGIPLLKRQNNGNYG
jgi:hypothetical protein